SGNPSNRSERPDTSRTGATSPAAVREYTRIPRWYCRSATKSSPRCRSRARADGESSGETQGGETQIPPRIDRTGSTFPFARREKANAPELLAAQISPCSGSASKALEEYKKT